MIYVVGHRGAAGVLPENTLRGFRYAIELGVNYVECDVHLTRDDRLVVIHDKKVDRTTNGVGYIRDLDFAAVRALDAGEGEPVPTLDEVLETVRSNVKLLCELKGEGVEDAAVDAVLARDRVFELRSLNSGRGTHDLHFLVLGEMVHDDLEHEAVELRLR